ncbi:MAG: hydroxysqualene dehydroxylase HpnE [Undibacterium sp.]|nr:hydroxysqualene dehydroxylase HpnE [Undibacterium sp.]
MVKLVNKVVNKPVKKVAVIGAGWAGCSAAVALAEQGHQVSLIEATRSLGGRARKVEINGYALDNGQHILLGAYTATLAILRKIGIDTETTLLRLPLQMCYPENSQGMQFVAPALPAPLHLLIALLRAKGLSREDKLSLARFSTTARWMGWQLHQDCSVSELLQRFDQTERLCKLMWVPLCIAALNTPPERASAKIFLNVLRDSLGAHRAASDMLLPRVDLSALLPEAAAAFITQRGGEILTGLSVKKLTQHSDQSWELESNAGNQATNVKWDAVIIATDPDHARRLLDNCSVTDNTSAPAIHTDFSYEPITTCYLQYPKESSLPRPFFALIDDAASKRWGQFVFDRGQLHQDQKGLMAVVVSASTHAIELSHAELAADIAQQLAKDFQSAALATPIWHQIISEKRATFSCTAGLKRPLNQTGMAGLLIAGDYTDCDYPATLEAAVRSGEKAAQELSASLEIVRK